MKPKGRDLRVLFDFQINSAVFSGCVIFSMSFITAVSTARLRFAAPLLFRADFDGGRGLVAVVLRFVIDSVFQRVRQILLLYVPAEIVRVTVAAGVFPVLLPAVNGVFQVRGHGVVPQHAGVLLCPFERDYGRVGLFRHADVNHRVSERNPPFGKADLFERGHCGDRDDERLRIRHAHVFRGMDDQPPREQHGIAAAGDQPFHIVERGVCVAAPEALAEGGQHIVIELFVEGQRLLLNGLFRVLQRDDDFPPSERAAL